MTNTAPIDYETALKEFLSARGWPEPIEADEETGSFVLRTGVNIGEHSGGRLIVHGTNSTGILRVYFYFPFRHKESKLGEMALLFNHIHNHWHYGRFMADADREIAWSHTVDFENLSPGGQSIENVVGPGWEAAAFFADLIAAVALTNQGAEAAVAEWREANAQAEEANGPDEL